MKIKLLTMMAGPEGVYQIGSVVDLPEQKAMALANAGYAELVDQKPPVVEHAVILPVEHAVAAPQRKQNLPAVNAGGKEKGKR